MRECYYDYHQNFTNWSQIDKIVIYSICHDIIHFVKKDEIELYNLINQFPSNSSSLFYSPINAPFHMIYILKTAAVL